MNNSMRISEYFDSNYKISKHPKDRRMAILDEKGIEGFSSENIRFMINEIVKKYAKDLYVEVGTWKGCSLISAALFNDNIKCIGIDNFSQLAGCRSKVIENIEISECKNAQLLEGNYIDIIPSLKEKSVDVYFYDGDHSYYNQLNGLNIILPYLKEECVIFVDDSSWEEPKKANDDWLKEHKDFKSVVLTVDDYDIETTCNNEFWWNGLTIMFRGVDISL